MFKDGDIVCLTKINIDFLDFSHACVNSKVKFRVSCPYTLTPIWESEEQKNIFRKNWGIGASYQLNGYMDRFELALKERKVTLGELV